MGTYNHFHSIFVRIKPRHPSNSRLNRSGGASRDRTDDLLHAMQALSQLSYSPEGNITKPPRITKASPRCK